MQLNKLHYIRMTKTQVPYGSVEMLGGGLPQESHASLAIFRVAEIFEIFDFWLKNVGFLRFLMQICVFSGKTRKFVSKNS